MGSSSYAYHTNANDLAALQNNRLAIEQTMARDAASAQHQPYQQARAAPLPPNPFPGAMTMSANVVLPPLAQSNQQQPLARFERNRNWNAPGSANGTRHTTSSHSNRSFGGPHRHGTTSNFKLDGTLRDNVSADERTIAGVPNYPARHTNYDTRSNFNTDGTLRDHVSSDEGRSLQRGIAYGNDYTTVDTQSSFNYDGSMKDHVSLDERVNGVTGGRHQHTPLSRGNTYAADHIGNGMNPTEQGSAAPPWAGSYPVQSGGLATRSAFNPDGSIMNNVSFDEGNSGVVGGSSRRHQASPVNDYLDPRQAAGRPIPHPTNEGFVYGSSA